MDVFEKLIDISDSAIALDSFLADNIQVVYDFSNSEYFSVLKFKDSIERFILFKSNIIEQLDYDKTFNKAFVSILLDLCERYNFIASTQRIYSIFEQNEINIGYRLQAALLFLYNIDSIPTLIDRFDLICEKIQNSIELEEDNDKKAVSTFLNYFSIVIRDTQPHIHYALELKSKIESALANNSYRFLNNCYVIKALLVDLNNADLAFNDIQILIDSLLNKSGLVKPIPCAENGVLLIENGFEYPRKLTATLKSFDSIRDLSVSLCNNIDVSVYYSLGRGVNILTELEQLPYYLKSFGNSHCAKMLSALDTIDFTDIGDSIEIIDWGCGQALASVVLLDYIEPKDIEINNVILIEPSEIAIKRGALHVQHMNSEINIKTICKKLDLLTTNDFNPSKVIQFNLFSNILDIDEYNQSQLISLINKTQRGLSYFICVSPDINEIKTSRLNSFSKFYENEYSESFNLLADYRNGGMPTDEYWNCNNKFNGKMNVFCNHTGNGCNQKWTRVVKVFSVEL